MKKEFELIEQDGFYNFLLSNTKFINKPWLVCLPILILLLIFYKDVFNLNSQNTYFYTFSTIVQGFLALVGFLGTVVVFKIQLIENDARQENDRLKPIIKEYWEDNVYGYSWYQMKDVCKQIKNSLPFQRNNAPMDYVQEAINGFENLEKLSVEKSQIRNLAVDFSLLSLINVTMALIGIQLSQLLLVKNLIFLDSFYLVGNVALSVLSVIIAFKIIKRCIGYSYTMRAGN